MKRDRVVCRPSKRDPQMPWTVRHIYGDGSGWTKSYHRSEFEARMKCALLRDEIKNG